MTDFPSPEALETMEELVSAPVPQVNYKEECRDLEDAIKSCVLEEFPLYFEGVTSTFQSLKEHTLVPEQHELYFRTISLPKIVLYILTRCDFHGNKDLQSKINNFLQEVLEYCIKHLDSDLREIYTTLNRILTPSMGYYIIPQDKRKEQETYSQAKKRCCPQEEDEVKYAQFRKTDPPLSMLYYLNINFFGNHNGFDTLLDRVKDTDPRNLILLKNILSPITICQEYLLKEFVEEYAPTMTTIMIEKLLEENSGPLVKNERNLTGAIIGSLKALYGQATSPEESLRMVDNFKMEFGTKGFTSTNLERSLRSLKVLTSLAERAMIKEEDKEGNFKSFMRKAVIVDPKGNEEEKILPFDPDVFQQWLHESQFVEKLLDPKAHPETIKQGIAIFRFLAINHMLTNEHIDHIWNMQIGKHESVKSTIFDSLVLLQEHLSVEHLHHIHQLLAAYDDTEYDYETTRFLSQFTPLAIEKNAPGAFEGLDTLYRLATAPIDSGINPNVTSTAFTDLSKIIKLNAVAPRRAHLIEAATTNLTICQSIVPSLQMIMNILNTYPVKKKKNPMARKEPTRRSVIEELNQSQNIVDSTLASIANIKDESRSLQSPEGLIKEKIEGRAFLDHLRVRLEFLEFLFSESSIRLSSVQLEMLWQNFVVQQIIPEESEMFIVWLVRTLPLFDEAAILSLFNGPMSHLDTISLSVTCYELYETYFLFLNEKGSTLLQSKSQKEYIVNHNVDKNIYGYEQLWHIALDAKDQEVAKKAAKCLNMLHQSITAENQKPRYLFIREEFISQCLNYLEVAISTEPPNLRHVNCCIQILKKMVLDYEAKVNRQTGVGNITIPVKTDKGANFSVTMRSTDTITTLRGAIAKEYGRPMNSIRVYHNGQVLRGDRTLKEAKISGSQQLLAEAVVYKKKTMDTDRFSEYAQESTVRSLITQVMELQLVALGLKGNQIKELIHNTSDPMLLSEESNLAVRIMAKQANFQRLFKLLNLQGDISGRAWDLLNILPPNSSMIEDIAQEDTLEKNLQVYLDPSVILKLAYSLNMISILVKQLQTKKETTNAWCDTFIALQGTHTLLHTLLHLPLAYSSAHITCFLQLLRLIEFFVTYERQQGQTDSLHTFPKLKEVFDLILVLSLALTEGKGSEDENEIVVMCISFIRMLLPVDPSFLAYYREWSSLSTYLNLLLLESRNNQVKHRTVDELTKLCREIQPEEKTAAPAYFLLEILLSFLPIIDKYPHSSDAYFALLQNLVTISKRASLEAEWAESMVLQLVEHIKAHSVQEPSNAPETKDVSLIGLFDLLRTILGHVPSLKVVAAQHGILNELFTNCLFNIPTALHHGPDAPPKCKTKDARYSAYRLLVELCRSIPENFSVVVEALSKNMGDVNPRQNWQIFPGHKNKASHGYVGLENLGATCYMNSLMQQLYVMPQFRELILSVKDESEEPEDSPLYQLQYMFAYLQETLKGSYSPTSFCSSYKDYDGNPVNTRLQMDANEFFNTLFDKLEGLLAPTSRPHILKELFGGVLSNQIISQGCEHISENTEAFYTVGIEMKNKVDILSSFELFIEGEMIEEYRCDLCDKKVNALKRCCLKSLPPILLIQMKRFEFDLMTMSNRKLNDRCEFPMELNVEPFTVEGIARKEAEQNVRVSQKLKETSFHFPPEHYEYQLAGVVVHTGTANGGHYYSFIKERVPLQGDECHWFEFNDSSVERWSPEKMAKACFGGMREVQQRNMQTGQTSTVQREILNNGYILVYERKADLSPTAPAERKTEAEQPTTKTDQENGTEVFPACEKAIGPVKSQVHIPEELMDKIWRENREFIVEKHIFDPNYFNFMWKLINLYTAPEYLRNPKEYVKPTMQAIEVAIRFMTEIYARSKENQLFPMWSHHLCDVFESYPTGSCWFLKALVTKSRLLKNMVIVCPMEKTREAYVRMIVSAMKSMRVTERERYNEQYEKLVSLEKPSEMDPKDVCSFNIVFIEFLFNLMKDARVPRFSNSQYFLLFQLFFELGMEEKLYFAKRGFFTDMIHFITGSGMFDKEKKPKEKEKGTKKAAFLGGVLNVNGTIYALHAILKGYCPTEKQQMKWITKPPPTVFTLEQEKEKTAGQIEETISSLIVLTDKEFEILRSEKLFLKVFKDCYNERVIYDLVAHVSWEDLPTIEFFIACCKTALAACMMQSQAKQYLKILVALQECHDTYYLNRLSQTIELVLEMIKETKNRDILRAYGNWISSRRGSVKKIKEYCSKNSSRINKVLAQVPPPSPPQKRK